MTCFLFVCVFNYTKVSFDSHILGYICFVLFCNFLQISIFLLWLYCTSLCMCGLLLPPDYPRFLRILIRNIRRQKGLLQEIYFSANVLAVNNNNGNFSFIFKLNYNYKSHYYKGNLLMAGLDYRIKVNNNCSY